MTKTSNAVDSDQEGPSLKQRSESCLVLPVLSGGEIERMRSEPLLETSFHVYAGPSHALSDHLELLEETEEQTMSLPVRSTPIDIDVSHLDLQTSTHSPHPFTHSEHSANSRRRCCVFQSTNGARGVIRQCY